MPSSGGGGDGLDSYISSCRGSKSAVEPPMDGGARVVGGVPKSWSRRSSGQKMGVLPALEMKGLGLLRQSMRGGGGGGGSEVNRLLMSWKGGNV